MYLFVIFIKSEHKEVFKDMLYIFLICDFSKNSGEQMM